MKRNTALFFIAFLCIMFSGCGKQQSYTDYTAYLAPSENSTVQSGTAAPAMQFAGSETTTGGQPTGSPDVGQTQQNADGGQNSDYTDFANVVTIVSTPAPVYTPVPTPAPTPFPIITPAPTMVPTPIPNQIRITKSPLSETLYEGGSCYFTAYADNASGITWITVSPDARNSYDIRDAYKVFPSLNVTGQGTNTLSLSNVPYSMNGWRIQAYFTGNGGPQYTAGAYLTVIPGGSATWPTPTPTYSPVDNTEATVSDLAKKAYSEVYYSASGNGFSVGSISNYIYWNGSADFNIILSNSRYQIIGEFTAYYSNPGSYGYGPTHMMVYDTYGNLRASENLTGQTISTFLAMLNNYRY